MSHFLIQDAEAVEARESYLALVQKSLTGQSPGEVYETVSEMRQHLDAMALADMELGSAPDLAMKAALDRFGSPESIARTDVVNPNAKLFRLTLEKRSLLKTIAASLVLFGITQMSVMSVLLVCLHSTQYYGFIINDVLAILPTATFAGFAAHLSLARPIKFALGVSLTSAAWMTVCNCFTMVFTVHTWPKAGPLLFILLQSVCYFSAALSIANYAKNVRQKELGRA